MTDEPRTLVPISDAARMLAEAETLPDIQRVANLAQRARDYAKAAKLGLEAQNSAAIICREAEAKAGELLIQMKESGERPSTGGRYAAAKRWSRSEGAPLPPTLADMGIDHNQSHDWQEVARVPSETRAAYYAEAQGKGEEVTRAGLLRYGYWTKSGAEYQAKVAALRAERVAAGLPPDAIVIRDRDDEQDDAEGPYPESSIAPATERWRPSPQLREVARVVAMQPRSLQPPRSLLTRLYQAAEELALYRPENIPVAIADDDWPRIQALRDLIERVLSARATTTTTKGTTR